MTTPKRFVQAYRQAPWRIQTQRGVFILVVAILGASILWIMLSVTVQAASAGLEVQKLETEQEDTQRKIANLRTQYANLTSAARMEQRASEMGFEPVTPESITYMIIPGYTGRQSQISAPPPTASVQKRLIKPIYTQSLWEWLLQGVLDVSERPGGISP